MSRVWVLFIDLLALKGFASTKLKTEDIQRFDLRIKNASNETRTEKSVCNIIIKLHIISKWIYVFFRIVCSVLHKSVNKIKANYIIFAFLCCSL